VETGRMLQRGAKVRYRRAEDEQTGKIVAITHCARRGDKFGKRVDELAWRDRETAFLLLDTGYCYGYELL
jgi:hypothetical protein